MTVVICKFVISEDLQSSNFIERGEQGMPVWRFGGPEQAISITINTTARLVHALRVCAGV